MKIFKCETWKYLIDVHNLNMISQKVIRRKVYLRDYNEIKRKKTKYLMQIKKDNKKLPITNTHTCL